MTPAIKTILVLAAAAVLLSWTVAAFWYVAAYAGSLTPSRTFQVSGDGEAVAVPDIGEFSFSVVTEGGKNLSTLQQANSEKANRIVAYLKESGVDEEDITTRMYDVSPRYQYYSCPPSLPIAVEDEAGSEARPCPPPEISGYTVTQNVSVKVRDLDKVGDLLVGVVDRGANNVSGLSFTVDDPEELRNEARAVAMAEAQEKAEAMAGAGGFSVGKLVSVSEDFGGIPVAPFAERGFGVGGGGEAPVIEPGSQEIRVSVTLTYELR